MAPEAPSLSSPAEETFSRDGEATQAACSKLIAEGSAVLFAGAGFAVPANFPDWSGILVRLETICAMVKPGFSPDATMRASDPIAYAARIRDYLAEAPSGLDRYHAELEAQFRGPPRLTQFHHDLVALPFRGFLTTNFDDTLESALAMRLADRHPPNKTVVVADAFPARVSEFLNGLTRPGVGRRVAHLHGYHGEPHTIVLGASDYQRVYGDGTRERPLVKFLEAILSTWSLVFVGFSFQDPSLIAFLEAATNRYFTWGRVRHFTYMGTSAENREVDEQRAARLLEKYGVATVFYSNDDKSHGALYALVRDLCQSLGISASPSLDELNDRALGRLLE